MNTKENSTKVTINGVEYDFKPCVKAMLIFETMTDKPFGLRGMTDIVAYIYAILTACNKGFEMEWNDFLSALDEPNLLSQLTEAIGGRTAVENIVAMSNEEGTESKKE